MYMYMYTCTQAIEDFLWPRVRLVDRSERPSSKEGSVAPPSEGVHHDNDEDPDEDDWEDDSDGADGIDVTSL